MSEAPPESSSPWVTIGVIVVLAGIVSACLCGGVIFWMMLGSPSLLDPSSLAE